MQRLCPECEKRYDADVLECPEDGEYTIEVPDDLATLLVGTTLDGRWHIEETLGEGGMGAVFRGRQENLDRPVAIKVLRAEVSGSDKIVARFMREARVLSRLNNPHVVTIFDFGRDSETGLLYLVMELLDGKPLGGWWDAQPTKTIDQALMIVEQIAKGLDEAHAQDIIHRDLKPDNIFVSPVAGGVHVKVLDFGIAKVHDENQAITHTGDIHGTPYYMAPEQIDGKTIVPATDLYAIGCILHEMFTERPPFVADSVMAILMHHCTKPVEPLEEHWTLEEAPTREILSLVHDLLGKDPAARPENTRALLERVVELRDPNHPMTPIATASGGDKPSDGVQNKLVDTLDFPATPSTASIEEGAIPPAFQATLEAAKEEDAAPHPEPEPPAPMASPPSPDALDESLFEDEALTTSSKTRVAAIAIALGIIAAIFGVLYLIGDDKTPEPAVETIETTETAIANTPPTDTEQPANTSTPEEVTRTSPATTSEAKPTPTEETTPKVASENVEEKAPPEEKVARKTPPIEKAKTVKKATPPPEEKKVEETTPREPAKVDDEQPPEEKKAPAKEDKDKDKTEIKVRVPPLKNDLSDELERLGNGR